MDDQRADYQQEQINKPPRCSVEPGDLRPDEHDPHGKIINDVYWTTEKYQIYLADNKVQYLLQKDPTKAEKLRKLLHEISQERETIEYQRQHRAIGRKDENHCARLLARCLAQAFDGNAQSAKEILDKLATRLSAKIQSHFRMKYAIGSGFALVLVLASLVLVLALTGPKAQGSLQSVLPVDPAVLANYAKFCICGALGAFLSVSIGLRNISFDLNLKTAEHIYAGGIRIIIGVIGAIVVGLALDSNLIAPALGDGGNAPVYYLLAFLAGFSETFVPNVLRKVEKTHGGVKGAAAPEGSQPGS